MKITGKVALVTGASRGIGRATALKLAAEGVDVAVHYNRAVDRAAAVCDEIRSAGQRAIPVAAEVTDRPAIADMVVRVTAELGPIDLLVNNAGVVGDVPFDQLTPDRWDHVLAVDLTGTFNVLWAVKDGMIERNFGRIVNVSSIAPFAPRPHLLAYATSKAGIIALTKSSCVPLAKHNVRINAIAPGMIRTDMTAGLDQEAVQKMVDETPIPRFGEPEEIADVIAYLLSEESSFITGTTVFASGGRLVVP